MIPEILHRLILGPLELLFDTVYALGFRVTGSPGLSIVLLSLAMNLMMLPIYRRADRIQQEEREQAALLKPGIEKIKRAFRGDERFMMLQTYYRQNGYKPYGSVLRGSLSLLLEVPFFMAAYSYLSGLNLLQGAAFGPIRDLGKPDALIMLGGTAIHLLPVLMTLISMISGAVYTRGLPRRESLQLYGMALVFLVLLYGAPSGLALYWTLNNAFSLAKNLLRKIADHGGGTADKKEKACGSDRGDEQENRAARQVFYGSCVLLTVLLGVLIPSAVIGASPGEFVVIRAFQSPLRYVLFSALTAAGTFLIWFALLFRLSSGKGRRRLAAVFAAASAAGIADYLFFGKGYGNLSTALKYDIPLSVPLSEGLLNLGAVLALTGLVLFLWKKRRDVLKLTGLAACISLCVLSVLNLHGIREESAALKAAADRETEKETPSFTLTREGKNVVVIMLDRCISGFIPYILEENPEIAEQLRGFTYYPNTLAFGRNTNVCTPSLYGGYEYRPFEMDKRTDLGLPEKQNEALKVLPVLFSENGWEVTVCDPPYAGYLWIPDLSIYDGYPAIRRFNTHAAFLDGKESARKMERTLSRNLFCYSVFRAAPVLLQGEIYDGGRYNEAEARTLAPGEEYGAVFQPESELRSTGLSEEFLKAYTALQHLPAMTEIAEEREGKDSPEQTFLILSNTTTHDVTMLQEPEFEPRPVVDNTAYEEAHRVRTSAQGGRLELKTLEQMEHYQSDTAALIQLGKWFDHLRENGVWENTRVIVVSDHGWELGLNHVLTGAAEGENALAPYDGVMAYNALMMIKDFGDGEAFRTDPSFMTIADTPSEAMRGLIENPVNPFTGNPISESAKSDPEQYVMLTDWRIAENHGTQYSDPIRLTLKNGYLFDESNWVLP
ncbi:MAG: YidC/Oxa1 family membrane protein insertase [Clostridia bacterium]|nr:YidC/Oxa1 family membrane protein insertase [Clostridia bacterium]